MLYFDTLLMCLKVIVTSFLFPDGRFSLGHLKSISGVVGKDRLVVDVRLVVFRRLQKLPKSDTSSCRRRADRWLVAMNKWQDITDLEVSKSSHS